MNINPTVQAQAEAREYANLQARCRELEAILGIRSYGEGRTFEQLRRNIRAMERIAERRLQENGDPNPNLVNVKGG